MARRLIPVLVLLPILILAARPEPLGAAQAAETDTARTPAKKQAAPPAKAPRKSPAAKPAAKKEPVKTPVQAAPADKTPHSLHGMRWGANLADLPHLTVVEVQGQAKYATVPNVPFRIGETPLREAVYAFCRERFGGALFSFSGKEHFEAIKATLKARHGDPLSAGEPGAALDTVGWALGDVAIVLEYDPAARQGTVTYFNAPLYEPCAGGAGR